MSKTFETLRVVLGLLGATLGGLLGGFDNLLYALIIFVVCDYATGLLAAFINKELNSYRSFKGICKKILYFVLVIVGSTLDTHLGIDFGLSIRTGVIYGLIFTEGISLLENMVKMDIPIPEILKKALEKLKPNDDDEKL